MNQKIYIKRDTENKIIAISEEPLAGFTEEQHESAEFWRLILKEPEKFLSENSMLYSDLKMIRVLEDLIEILIEKNLVRLTELPEAAQNKLISRKRIRSKISDFFSNDSNTGNDNIDI